MQELNIDNLCGLEEILENFLDCKVIFLVLSFHYAN